MAAAPIIKQGGQLIFTVKLVSRSEGAAKTAIRKAQEGLAPAFDVTQECWLFANRVRERTLIAIRK